MKSSSLTKIVVALIPTLFLSCASYSSKTIPGTIYSLPTTCDDARQYFYAVRNNDELFDREKSARVEIVEANIIFRTLAYNWAFDTNGESKRITIKYSPSDIALKDKEMKRLLDQLDEVNKEKDRDHNMRLTQSDELVKKFCGANYGK